MDVARRPATFMNLTLSFPPFRPPLVAIYKALRHPLPALESLASGF